MEHHPTAFPGPLLSRAKVIDLYFLEHRAKLLDLAAFLDRVDRAQPSSSGEKPAEFLVEALQRGIAVLLDGRGERTRRILDLLSDPTLEPLESAAGLKGAYGAWADSGVREAVSV
ncbi:MAG TPA: hypothetical protein VF756_28460 [Thermoanaerobaculia bacterium]